jgi:hypothetical protein
MTSSVPPVGVDVRTSPVGNTIERPVELEGA